jgi:hypothetical protein
MRSSLLLAARAKMLPKTHGPVENLPCLIEICEVSLHRHYHDRPLGRLDGEPLLLALCSKDAGKASVVLLPACVSGRTTKIRMCVLL